MRTLAVVALCAVGVAACGGNNSLSGSAGDYADLHFDNVSITARSDSTAITYSRNDGSVPNKIGIDTTALNIKPGIVVDGNDFLHYATVSRSETDPNDVWPAIFSGQIKFDDYDITSGGSVSGSFTVVFGPGGKFPSAGYELLGDFSGKTQVTQ